MLFCQFLSVHMDKYDRISVIVVIREASATVCPNVCFFRGELEVNFKALKT